MNPFTGVIIIAVFTILLFCKGIHKKYLALFSLSSAVEINAVAGYFLMVGGREIGYSDLTLVITSITAIVYLLSENRINRNQFLVSLLIIVTVLLGVVHTMISTPNTKIIDYSTGWDAYLYGYVELSDASITAQTILMLIKFLLYLLNSYVVIRFGYADLRQITGICKALIKVHITYALVEVATKYILRTNALTEFRNIFFGLGGSTESSFRTRGSGVAIYGWTREASHLTEVMFLFLVMCILTKDIKNQKVWMLFAAVIMAASMSFSTLMYVVCIVLLFIVVYGVKINKRTFAVIFLGCCAVVGLGYVLVNNEYYMGRLSGFFADSAQILSGVTSFSREMVTSSKVRLMGITETLKGFFERPLFGLGLGTAYCNSGIVSLLSNIGLVGTGLWIYYCVRFGISNRRVSQILAIFFAVLILPNVIKGGLGMLYATYNLLFASLVKIDFDVGANLFGNKGELAN